MLMLTSVTTTSVTLLPPTSWPGTDIPQGTTAWGGICIRQLWQVCLRNGKVREYYLLFFLLLISHSLSSSLSSSKSFSEYHKEVFLLLNSSSVVSKSGWMWLVAWEWIYSVLRVPPITLIQSKVDKIEEVEEHLSLDASVHLKARDFNLFKDFKFYLGILDC